MSCLRLEEYNLGPLRFRPSGVLKAGDACGGHTHNFDHVTFICSGSVRVKAQFPDGTTREGTFKAGTEFFVAAEVVHEITAIEDGTMYKCVYVHRDPTTGDPVDQYTGFEEAYR